ncbi:PRD domain-containing protein [Ligilactobacillus sp. WILCCON 0076]|uniref:PRD domain-containing protein n=1 Tax=Ligilactobacillus ubinensis TaxID=2876789 RepID=A0A9X2JMG9_9LACO|nr:PRD domain-containing protein [Ligilactobacillus ubinensis]MCP0888028.1 PRD domain-containing protein [Ligilactobacillus ubinensis]
MTTSVSRGKIINYLSNQIGYIDAQEIADHFGVSKKTIYRKIDAINNVEEGAIISKKGQGFKLNTNFSFKTEKIVNNQLDEPIKRRNRVFLTLLFNSPSFVSYSSLYKNAYVSQSTVKTDIKFLRKDADRFFLKFKVTTNKIAVIGNEKNIRNAINSILQFDYDKNNAFIKGINKFDDQFIREQIKFIETSTGYQLPYPYNINIFSHIYILIKRSRRKSSFKSEEASFTESSNNPVLYRISSMIIENVENYIVHKLPKYEIKYLYNYLIASRLTATGKKENEVSIVYSSEVEAFTKDLIIQANIYLEIKEDLKNLQHDLVKHVGPMINRLKNDISIENGILEDIQSEYQNLFDVLKRSLKKICEKYNLPITSDNEVGFITLYFAKYLETVAHKYHVWIVCASGVGTSELLKVKINNSFKNIVVDAVLSSVDDKLNNIPEDVDLIISTVNLNKNISKKIVIVSALLNKLDKEKIDNELKY